MKKLNKILSIILLTSLLFTPCYTYANNEQNNETTNNNEVENNQQEGSENNNEDNKNEETKEEEEENKPTESPEPSATPVTYNITLDKKELDLDSNKTETIKATTTPEDAELIWESENEEIATVDENGKVTAKSKAGTTKVTATIKGTEKSATCTVNVTRTIGKDATLKSLNISNGTLNKTFKPDTLEYSVTIDSDVTSLKFKNLKNDLNDSNAGYLVTGNDNLKNGDIVKILVTAEDDKTQKTYQLTIIKDEISLNLKSLEINGYALNEIFDPEKLEYSASIPYEIQTITVNANASSKEVTVKTSGLTNLKVGKNTVKITVTDEAGNSKQYKIIVTREKEVTIDEKPTSIITSNNINNDKNPTTQTPNTTNNSGGDDFLKYAIVSLACLILFAIGGIGIYFYLKTSPKKLRKELDSLKEKSEKESSPIIEVESNNQINKQGNIEEIMNEKLVETREFTKEDLEETKEPIITDDSKDV